ncbi:12552_t:CDS:1 [Dentiscutata erythropus]|uniref:12552_t:CDS:1 n=1 Tax=Dentiscutata erythropus TaxID=1348616 RepID=A0A9N9P5F1_9GLOM|nr:12552_t:CDS:1 [Dentiscutata erythropus]
MSFTISLIIGELHLPLEICSADTISQVKQKIQNKNSIKIENQELFLSGKKLEDNKTVKSYNIGLDEKIRLVQKTEGLIQVFIKGVEGKSTAIFIKPTSTVLELKRSYNEKEKIPVKEQRLIHSSKQLEDNKKLLNYGIKHDSTIHLLMRLHGGL